MSNRLSSKPSKKDRPKSTDKTRSKKRDGGTPDKLVTPVGSTMAIQDEVVSGPPVGNIISGDDIDSLAISVEELKKMRPPKPPETPKTASTLLVRKTRLKTSEAEQPTGKNVTVARPAPTDAPLITSPLIGPTGPAFSEDGQPLAHTILGSWQDFHMEAIQRGDIENLPPFPPFQFSRGSSEGSKAISKSPFPQHVYQTTLNESNALRNWTRQMGQRKTQQRHLTDLMNVRSDMLVMNQSEDYRKIQEQRYLVDRAIPSMDYGKGYRVGSEFWKQVEPIGNDETGLTMTLSQTERGYPPPVEHISKPIVVKKEMGVEWSETNRTAAVHYPWHKSSYLKERKGELQDTIRELDPHQPYLDELEVIGTSRPANPSKYAMETLQEVDEAVSDASSMAHDPLAMHADVFPQPILGPSLTIAGKVAQWTGSTTSGLGHVGVDKRVTFEGSTGDRVVSKLDICNDGTTAIYYSWKSVPKANSLGTRLAGHTQRFYFNTNSGVILPGETMNFPFIFKSPNAGIFTETWELLTQPVLCGGAAMRVTLRGVATQEDTYSEERQKIEEELAKREALEAAKRILDEILDGVRTPKRPSSPVDAYITQEEVFSRRNEGMHFNDEAVQELKAIHSELEVDTEWDLSIVGLKRRVMAVEEDEQREDLLQKLNTAVISLSFPPMTPIKHAMYTAGYQLLCELVDSMVNQAVLIRTVLGLPEREMVEDTSHEEETKKSRKVTASDTRADTKSRDKKDKKGTKLDHSDRPNSQTQRLKHSAGKKTGRSGTITPTSQSKSAMSDGPVVDRSGTPASGDGSTLDSVDPVVEAKYKQKIFTQMYGLVVDTLHRMELMFEDIKNSDLKPDSDV